MFLPDDIFSEYDANLHDAEEEEEEEEEYRSSEQYLDQTVTLHPGPGLPAGSHLLPFSLRLPPGLPSSFTAQHGRVAYHLTADLVRDEEDILSVREEIRLSGLLDLNLEPEARLPGSSSRQKNLGCFCWRSGGISASLQTARTGYVSGEVVQFQAELENNSSSDLDSVILSLVEEVTFKTRGGERREEREVARLRWREKLLARSGEDWEGSLALPSLPPSGLAGHCSIIDLQYRLELQLNPGGHSSSLVVSLPIMLGTRPLQPLQQWAAALPVNPHSLSSTVC